MRLLWITFSLFIFPSMRDLSASESMVSINRLMVDGANVRLNHGSSIYSTGHYASYLDSTGTFWFYCFDLNPCELELGISKESLAVRLNGGHFYSDRISDLNVHLSRSSATIVGNNRLTLTSFESPTLLKPARGADIKVSQQRADIILILPEIGWDIIANVPEAIGLSSVERVESQDITGRASIQLSEGSLIIPETLVSLRTP